ncbi:MAG: dipeptide epimerase [Fimbriimonadaceae bacterium]|nr:dipeptide epimerase [Fimbriimonadaceae bacterium]
MRLTWRRLALHYHHTFRISRGGSDTTSSLLVELRHHGLIGRGEGVPVRFYGWTLDSMEATLAALQPAVEAADPRCADALMIAWAAAQPAQRSALCALDGALWDLAGQLAGQPVYRMLGLDPAQTGLTAFTIGLADLDEMLAKAAEAAQYPILKVKCGGSDDLAKVRALREATGKRLWVDANGGWDVAAAADLAGQLAALGVELIEQPVGRDDYDGLAAVQAVSPLPIVADESCHGPDDVLRLRGSIAGVNVKLDKVGGLSAALRTIHVARACGMRVMLGCFGASSVSLAAAAQLAPLVDWCDLDGALLVSDDPFAAMTAPDGRITLPDRPGLGITVR